MDSLTQIVLGAAVGEVMLGKKIGNKALLFGAIAGTIPDLDVVLNLFTDDPISKIRIHRSYSHSMFTHFVLALPLTWLSLRWSKAEISKMRWYWFWFLGLFTHALLDCCTTYGTRLFLPFTDYQVAFNNVSVVDPLYTIPFLLILATCMFIKRHNPKRIKIAWVSIAISSLYMLFTFFFKYTAYQKLQNHFTQTHPNVSNTQMQTSPTIFNALLWAGMVHNQDSMWVAEYSIIAPQVPIHWRGYPRQEKWLTNFKANKDYKTIHWFADDQYIIEPKSEDSLHFYNVKWGSMNPKGKTAEEEFMIYYKLVKNDNQLKITAEEPDTKKFDFKKAFRDLWNRIIGKEN